MKRAQKRVASVILAALLTLSLLCGCEQKVSDSGNTGGLDLDYVGEGDLPQEETEAEEKPWYSFITDAFDFGNTSQPDTSSDTTASNGTTASAPNSVQEVYEQGTANYEAAQEEGPDSQTGAQAQTTTPSGNSSKPERNPGRDEPAQEEQEQPNADGGQQQETPQAQPETPSSQEPSSSANTVTMTIRCDTAVANGMHLESKWAGIVPASGVILDTTTFEIEDGDTVLDVLLQARDRYKLHVEYSGTQSGAYVEGINNLYEFDGGRWSGWMYCVNDWYPNYGCGVYYLKAGDVIEWNYTCDLGLDLDAGMEGAEDWKNTHE